MIKISFIFFIFFLSTFLFSSKAFSQIRVISLVPSTTDIIVKIGKSKLLIGVSDYCSTNKKVCKLKKFGTALKINWEQLVLAKPDIIFIDSYTKKKDKSYLKKLKIKTISFPHNTLKEIKQSILIVGKALKTLTKANINLNNFNKKLLFYKNKFLNKNVLLVLLEHFNTKDITSAYVAGKQNFYTDLIDLLGAKNVAKFNGYRNIDMETLYSYHPDFVISIKEPNEDNVFKQGKMNSNQAKLSELWSKIYPKTKVLIITSRDGLIPSINIISFLKNINTAKDKN